jgi:DNA-binding transcriptional MerR regulator
MGESIQLVGLTTKDLESLFSQAIKNELKSVKEHLQTKQPNNYLTRKEVAEMLKIDLSSVHNWSKKGILNPYQIGNRVYYKLSEVENAIIKLNR